MRQLIAFACAVLALFGTGPGAAQQSTVDPSSLELGTVISQVLTIDTDRLFSDSAFGRRYAKEDAARRVALSADNRRVEAELAAEEQELTQKRSEMEAEDFRALADAFDEKVQQTKSAILAKNRELEEILLKERDAFFRAARPVMEQLMLEAGAAVILELRLAFVSVRQIEITDRAIALLDETIGSGAAPD